MKNFSFTCLVFFSIHASKVLSDEYVVSISSVEPRVIDISATIETDGMQITMNDEGVFGLKNGWATFVENLRVFDEKGS